MPVRLKSIEIENFKSFKGRILFDQFKSLTAVIGPNGSGKSNFMDAISFVMGEKTSCLRVQCLEELIHGALIGKPVSKTASVIGVFVLDDGSEKTFTRLVRGSSSEHQINGDNVTYKVYLEELRNLGVNVKAKNFLVFQGSVESIAMKNPKEITALIEESSGSGALKNEYDRLKVELSSAEKTMQYLYHKKKGVAFERKGAKLETEEAAKYQRLEEDYMCRNIEIQLFRLYHNRRSLDNMGVVLRERQEELENLEKKKRISAELLKDRKKKIGKALRELSVMDQNIRVADLDLRKKKTNLIKAEQHTAHLQEKLECNTECLDKAQVAAQVHKNVLKELEMTLQMVEDEKAAYDATACTQRVHGRDIQLEDEQIQEYNLLKEQATTAMAINFQELGSAERLLKSDKDRLENECRKERDLKSNIERITRANDDAKKREDLLTESLVSMQDDLEKYQKEMLDMQSGIGASEDEVQTLKQKLTKICEQLGDATLDSKEFGRLKKKAEIVKTLQSAFYPGVYGRMVDVCTPLHERYGIAITKVCGKFMNAIIVDTESIARQCIQYLKEQCSEPETFLPLDTIRCQPVKERLRRLGETSNVKLLYDVVKFAPSHIEPAVRFVMRNTLVCESPEDARRVAYDIDRSTKNDCVALDGTFYQKSGIISGGHLDLARRVKQWDAKQIAQLELQKQNLRKELAEKLLKSRQKDDLNLIVPKIAGVERRQKYARIDLEVVKQQIIEYEAELKNLQLELAKVELVIADIKESIAKSDRAIENIKQKSNDIEDELFRSFCEEIGVSNIREYEEQELSVHQDRQNRLIDFENQCNLIRNQLDFERQRQTDVNISRWEKNVYDAEIKIASARQYETECKDELRSEEDEIEKLKTERNIIKEATNQKKEEVKNVNRDVIEIAKDVLSAQRNVNGIEMQIDNLKAKRHFILIQCKVESIEIPMHAGNIRDLPAQSSPPTGDSEPPGDSSQEQYQREDKIAIDYTELDEELKGIEVNDVARMDDNLTKAMINIQEHLREIQAPNMKAHDNLAQATEKFYETNKEFATIRKNVIDLKKEFEKVQKERRDRFMTCIQHVSEFIDPTYKHLTNNSSAQAFLELSNPEEPYLDGIIFNCVVPGKRFQPMSNLSGGEKTVAALALLFAIHSIQPAPFFVLDEIDAALDNTNINKVVRYIRRNINSVQMIVISLKAEFYCHADTLYGIREIGECRQSTVTTFSLMGYKH